MKKEKENLKHYVTFLFPGVLMSETETNEVKNRETKNIKPPHGCFAFYFFDRTEIVQGKERLVGKDKNHSGRFYVGGELYNLAELKRAYPDLEALATSMECNNWKKVILCSTGNWQPFFKDDSIEVK